MSIDKVWVLAETADGALTSTTLELLTKARTMGATTEALAWGTGTAAVAPVLGAYGATTVHDVGDIGDALPGAPVAAAPLALCAAVVPVMGRLSSAASELRLYCGACMAML